MSPEAAVGRYDHPELGFAIELFGLWSLLEEGATRALFALADEKVPRPAIVTVNLQAIDSG